MWNSHVRVSRIELKRVTSLTIVRVRDPLHETAVGLRLMAIIAIELLTVHRWNVGREMALMIKTKHVRIARVLAFELKLRMRFPKIRERAGVTLLRPRQFENDLLRPMPMPIKRVARKRPPLF